MSESIQKSFIFFYPSKIVGGAEYLFTRIAKDIAPRASVYIVDYVDGFLRNELKATKCKFIDFDDSSCNPECNFDNGIVITYPQTQFIAANFFKNNSTLNVLVWVVQSFGFFGPFLGARNIPNKFYRITLWYRYRKLLSDMDKNNSLFFMDGETYSANTFFFKKEFKKKYLPVTVSSENQNSNNLFKAKHSNSINVFWLGRLCAEKTSILKYILNELDKIGRNDSEFFIIGQGETESELKEYCLKFKFPIRFLGTVTDDTLKSLLKENADILFAMGTSAIESALLKIPTVLCDFSLTEIEAGSYKFRWFNESKDYTLGWDINNLCAPKGTWTVSALLNAVDDLVHAQVIAQRCFDHVVKHHLLANQIDRFIDFAHNSQQKLSAFTRFSHKQSIIDRIIRRLFLFIRK